MNKPHNQPPGPLRIPDGRAPSARVRRLVTESLRGHVTSEQWLPADTDWPGLAELRDEQLRHRDQVAAALDVLQTLEAGFQREDKDHAEKLRDAYRDGTAHDIVDDRTAAEDRDMQVAQAEARMWASVEVFAEFVDRALDVIRDHEDEWIGRLRGDLAQAHEKRREAQRLLRQASVAEWAVSRTGAWLLDTSDDGPLARQPAPRPDVPAPRDFSQAQLERPWHRGKPQTAPAESMPEITGDEPAEFGTSEMIPTS